MILGRRGKSSKCCGKVFGKKCGNHFVFTGGRIFHYCIGLANRWIQEVDPVTVEMYVVGRDAFCDWAAAEFHRELLFLEDSSIFIIFAELLMSFNFCFTDSWNVLCGRCRAGTLQMWWYKIQYSFINRQLPDISGTAGILRTPAAGYIRRYMPRLYWYLATGIFCLWHI